METCAFLKELFGMDGQVAVIIGGTGALGLALRNGRVLPAGRASQERGEGRRRVFKAGVVRRRG